MPRLTFFLCAICAFISTALQAQIPEWIWTSPKAANNEARFFRKTFVVDGKVKQATLAIAADDEADIWINGVKQSTVKGWNNAVYSDVTAKIKPGKNIIAVRGFSPGGEAAFLAKLELTIKKQKQSIVSDSTWKGSTQEEKGWQNLDFSEGANWKSAISRGKLGVAPWGEVMKPAQATLAKDLTVAPGFKVELLRSAQPGEGSWICMTMDSKGRLIVSPQQDDLPLFRITLSQGKIVAMEPISAPIHQTMGLLWAHDSLYANGHGPDGTGLYRLIDKNKNDQFEADEVHFLKKMPGEGEHGYHAVVEGPDGMIYVMNGNHTKLPEGISPTSPHQHYDEDFLLPRQWDAGGHAVGILAPGGQVMRTDPDGKNWELMLAGFRNSYDMDFNADGELFTFDSDMEWEWGMPWYRPTRILHCVTGAEFGWRAGSGKWPAYYPDSLPATLDIGIGSPTGVKFGTKSNFPEKYKNAFYAFDWSYGRIFAVHLKPDGASYKANAEVFVKGKPLNLTDVEFGNDGSMYFITGGRGTQSGLYRVSYTGGLPKEKKSREEIAAEKTAAEARKLRHALETFHGVKNPKAIEAAWPFLGSEDRFIRYAARIAVESQDVSLWKDRAINETNTRAGLTALLALARLGGHETQNDLLNALKKFPFDSLNDAQKLEKLRIIELSFIRQGKPEPEMAKLVIEKLNRIYPNTNYLMNRELCQLLVFLEAPGVIQKTFTLFDSAKTQEEQIHYILTLRTLKSGWTLEQRKKYFEWFKYVQQDGKEEVTYPQGSAYRIWADQSKAAERHPPELIRWFSDVGRDYGDGASYTKQLVSIRKDAIATLTEAEKTALADLISESIENRTAAAPAKIRNFVKEWKMGDLESALEQVGHGRNFENGKTAFRDAQCIVCHRFGNEGGAIGPELTAASSKYSRKDILDSILEPSKVVSEQYQNYTVFTKDGENVTGRIMDETPEKISVATNPLDLSSRVEIKKSEITKQQPAKLSPMPEGLLNNFSQAEILDLLAYIEAMGKAKAPNFSKEKRAAKN